MEKKLTSRVAWVGKIDWELKHFHGDELSTHFGSSYNAYLIRDKKNVLVDTVWSPYDTEFVAHLKEAIDLNDIDYIVMNHNENDHSGALPALMREIPNTPIYCTKKGEEILRGLYHQDWNFVNVKTGDTLNIGDNTLTFIECPMCHWPDTMVTYADKEQILFSNDVFGQHYASESLYDDTVNQRDLFREAEKYYANILNLYNRNVKRKVDEIVGMNLPLKMIAPSHGVIWTDHIPDIIAKYQQWDCDYQENQITIALDLYDTTLVAPNYSFLGKLNGYMTGRLYDVWFVTDFKIKKGKATVRFSNDLGSDEQEICFTFDKNGQLLYETVGNNVIRRAENRKWIKLPTKMLFVSKDSKAKKP